MESRRGGLQLPRGAEERLLVFPRAELLLQTLQELEHTTQLKVHLAFNKRTLDRHTKDSISLPKS